MDAARCERIRSILTLKAYVNDRDYHALTAAYDVADVARIDGELVTLRMGEGTPWYLRAPGAQFEEGQQWYYGFRYDAEAERGLDDPRISTTR